MNGDRDRAFGDIDDVEALLLLADAGRGRGARLHDQHAAGPGDEVARVLAGRVMIVAGEHHVDARLFDRVEREFLAPDRSLDLLADLEREQRMMGDEHPHRYGVDTRAKVSRMNATWSLLIRPSLKVSDRAVLIPSTASPGSSMNGHRLSSMKRR